MAGTGPAHLFVYYQKPYRMNEQGEIEELRQPAEFIVTDGKFEFLTVGVCWRQPTDFIILIKALNSILVWFKVHFKWTLIDWNFCNSWFKFKLLKAL